MEQDSFKEYIVQVEPSKRDKGYAWHTAIGLQAVDALKPSQYLLNTAVQNIEGEITLQEAQERLNLYYEENPERSADYRTEEADKVSLRIAMLLSENAFSFTPNEYISIHRKLFYGIYDHAGKIRDYNISKKEWVLDGETVQYGSASELQATLEYDLMQEKNFNYKGISINETIHHLAVFVSRLWQIHIFSEGNTRTTAVFFIKYLRTLGFKVENTIFAENAWYFRNSLVRANYNDIKNGIHETTEFLELFLKNLLLDEQNTLHNRSMHIYGMFQKYQKPDIQTEKPDIESQKPDIQTEKLDIDFLLIYQNKLNQLTKKTITHTQKLFLHFGNNQVFGRMNAVSVLGLSPSRTSELLRTLLKAGVLEPVSGYGKGKYKFVEK